MRRFIYAAVLLGSLVLGACSPSLNWREVRLDGGGLTALLPCKPDRASRPMASHLPDTILHMAGCEAGGALFAVSYIELKSPDLVLPMITQWRAATLSQLRIQGSSAQAFLPQGAIPLPQSELLKVRGLRPDGSAVQAQLVWFARGLRVLHAAVYDSSDQPEANKIFFDGLQIQ